jgi:hypothetical protein
MNGRSRLYPLDLVPPMQTRFRILVVLLILLRRRLSFVNK